MRRYTVAIDDQTFTIDVAETASDAFEVSVDGRIYAARLTDDRDLPGVAISPGVANVPGTAIVPGAAREPGQPRSPARDTVPEASSGAPSRSSRPVIGTLTAPMPGVVVEVLVAPGAAVRRGDPLLVLEAMKMRNTIRAAREAIVTEVAVAPGAGVSSGDVLVRFGAPTG
jgi:biotin carboxyl carrier protein